MDGRGQSYVLWRCSCPHFCWSSVPFHFGTSFARVRGRNRLFAARMPPWRDCCSPPSTIPFGLLASPTQVTLGLRQRLSSYCSCGKHRRGSLSSFVPSAVLGSRYF